VCHGCSGAKGPAVPAAFQTKVLLVVSRRC
jgi:hypothetical protein